MVIPAAGRVNVESATEQLSAGCGSSRTKRPMPRCPKASRVTRLTPRVAARPDRPVIPEGGRLAALLWLQRLSAADQFQQPRHRPPDDSALAQHPDRPLQRHRMLRHVGASDDPAPARPRDFRPGGGIVRIVRIGLISVGPLGAWSDERGQEPTGRRAADPVVHVVSLPFQDHLVDPGNLQALPDVCGRSEIADPILSAGFSE